MNTLETFRKQERAFLVHRIREVLYAIEKDGASKAVLLDLAADLLEQAATALAEED